MNEPKGEGTDERWTCGKGLAHHAAIPARMAEYLRTLAQNLDAHVPTIRTTDVNGVRERDAYVELSAEYTALGDRLAAIAERMRGFRDLPEAQHDEELLAAPQVLRAFQAFVALETELAKMLGDAVEHDRQLLRQFPDEDA